MYKLQYSSTFRKGYRKLPNTVQERIRSALFELRIDPFTRRTGLPIKKLSGFDQRKWRVRIGDYRVIYLVEESTIKVIEVFPRGRGYRFEFF